MPTADIGTLRERGRLLRLIRDFFSARGVLEVETPVLSNAGNSDPGIEQFSTLGITPSWLRTSPEYPMKRLLAAGSGDIYELGRVFRKGEAGSRHNPEFTLLEWYRVGWGFQRLGAEVVDLLLHCAGHFNQQWTSRRISYRDWFLTATELDPLTASLEALQGCAAKHGINTGSMTLDKDGWLDLLLSHLAQPALAEGEITVISGYPASQAALARLSREDPRIAERFEVFIGPMELANGYQELTDAAEQRQRFEAEQHKRQCAGANIAPLDKHLLEALNAGLPHCSGVALGVDRLLMSLLGLGSISAALAFDRSRA